MVYQNYFVYFFRSIITHENFPTRNGKEFVRRSTGTPRKRYNKAIDFALGESSPYEEEGWRVVVRRR